MRKTICKKTTKFVLSTYCKTWVLHLRMINISSEIPLMKTKVCYLKIESYLEVDAPTHFLVSTTGPFFSSFCVKSTWQKLEYLKGGNLTWEYTRSCCRIFFKLVIGGGGPSLLWGTPSACSPRYYKKVDWASYDEQTGM